MIKIYIRPLLYKNKIKKQLTHVGDKTKLRGRKTNDQFPNGELYNYSQKTICFTHKTHKKQT